MDQAAGKPPQDRTGAEAFEQLNDLAQAVVSRTGGAARRMLSPWVQRSLPAPGGPARTFGLSQRGRTAFSEQHTRALLNRATRRAEDSQVWRPELGSLEPAMVARFTGAIVERFPDPSTRYEFQPLQRALAEPTDLTLVGGGAVLPPEGAGLGAEADSGVEERWPTLEELRRAAEARSTWSRQPVRPDQPPPQIQRAVVRSPEPRAPLPPSPPGARIFSRVEEVTPGGKTEVRNRGAEPAVEVDSIAPEGPSARVQTTTESATMGAEQGPLPPSGRPDIASGPSRPAESPAPVQRQPDRPQPPQPPPPVQLPATKPDMDRPPAQPAGQPAAVTGSETSPLQRAASPAETEPAPPEPERPGQSTQPKVVSPPPGGPPAERQPSERPALPEPTAPDRPQAARLRPEPPPVEPESGATLQRRPEPEMPSPGRSHLPRPAGTEPPASARPGPSEVISDKPSISSPAELPSVVQRRPDRESPLQPSAGRLEPPGRPEPPASSETVAAPSGPAVEVGPETAAEPAPPFMSEAAPIRPQAASRPGWPAELPPATIQRRPETAPPAPRRPTKPEPIEPGRSEPPTPAESTSRPPGPAEPGSSPIGEPTAADRPQTGPPTGRPAELPSPPAVQRQLDRESPLQPSAGRLEPAGRPEPPASSEAAAAPSGPAVEVGPETAAEPAPPFMGETAPARPRVAPPPGRPAELPPATIQRRPETEAAPLHPTEPEPVEPGRPEPPTPAESTSRPPGPSEPAGFEPERPVEPLLRAQTLAPPPEPLARRRAAPDRAASMPVQRQPDRETPVQAGPGEPATPATGVEPPSPPAGQAAVFDQSQARPPTSRGVEPPPPIAQRQPDRDRVADAQTEWPETAGLEPESLPESASLRLEGVISPLAGSDRQIVAGRAGESPVQRQPEFEPSRPGLEQDILARAASKTQLPLTRPLRPARRFETRQALTGSEQLATLRPASTRLQARVEDRESEAVAAEPLILNRFRRQAPAGAPSKSAVMLRREPSKRVKQPAAYPEQPRIRAAELPLPPLQRQVSATAVDEAIEIVQRVDETPPATGPAAEGAGGADLDQLARQVYPLIKRLLAVERERRVSR